MKIVFAAATYDPQDVTRGSGTYYHMSREIERQGHEVLYEGPFEVPTPWPTRVLRSITLRCGRRYKTYLDPWITRVRGETLTKRLRDVDADLLITNDYGLAAYTTVQIPIVLYTDAMLPHDYAKDVPAASRAADIPLPLVWLFQRTIHRGMTQAQLCVFPSAWTAREAQKYGIPSSKVEVVPFGANLDDPEPHLDKSSFPGGELLGALRLLFVGKKWEQKGGEEAVAITDGLRHRGIDAHLHVVGTTPEVGRAYIHEHGLLDKSIPEEKALLHQLYVNAHVLLLPSRYEGFGIVAVEAAAYGVPALAYRVGGLTKAVTNGKSGYLFDPTESVKAFVDTIERWKTYPEEYEALSRGARTYYEREANWSSSITALFDAVERLSVVQT